MADLRATVTLGETGDADEACRGDAGAAGAGLQEAESEQSRLPDTRTAHPRAAYAADMSRVPGRGGREAFPHDASIGVHGEAGEPPDRGGQQHRQTRC